MQLDIIDKIPEYFFAQCTMKGPLRKQRPLVMQFSG